MHLTSDTMNTTRHSSSAATICHRAFTLLEVLVTIAIIAALAALLLPVLGRMRERGEQTSGLSNMRQIGAAFHLYAGEHEMELPTPTERMTIKDRWPKLLANYLQDVKVYAAPGIQDNFIVRKTDPLSNTGNNTNYIMNGFNDLVSFESSDVQIRIVSIESPSTTLLLGMQKPGSHHYFMDYAEPPHGNQKDLLELKAYRDGSNYLFADGSARFIAEKDYRDELWLPDKTLVLPNL